jgi:hypothetical protein
MHDMNGTPLKVGDIVTVEYVIKTLHGGSDFCNVSALSVAPRKPDGQYEYFTGNTHVMVLKKSAPNEYTEPKV